MAFVMLKKFFKKYHAPAGAILAEDVAMHSQIQPDNGKKEPLSQLVKGGEAPIPDLRPGLRPELRVWSPESAAMLCISHKRLQYGA